MSNSTSRIVGIHPWAWIPSALSIEHRREVLSDTTWSGTLLSSAMPTTTLPRSAFRNARSVSPDGSNRAVYRCNSSNSSASRAAAWLTAPGLMVVSTTSSFAFVDFRNEPPEPEVRVCSQGTRKGNRIVEFQLEPSGSPVGPTPCATLVEVGANRREPAQRPRAGCRRHAGACARDFLGHSLQLLRWLQFGSSAARAQRCQEGRPGSPSARPRWLRACLGHALSHHEDRIVVLAKDTLDAKKGVEFSLVDATCTVRKPHSAPQQAPRRPIRLRQPERMPMPPRDAAVSLAASEPPGRCSGHVLEARGGLIADLSSHSYEIRQADWNTAEQPEPHRCNAPTLLRLGGGLATRKLSPNEHLQQCVVDPLRVRWPLSPFLDHRLHEMTTSGLHPPKVGSAEGVAGDQHPSSEFTRRGIPVRGCRLLQVLGRGFHEREASPRLRSSKVGDPRKQARERALLPGRKADIVVEAEASALITLRQHGEVIEVQDWLALPGLIGDWLIVRNLGERYRGKPHCRR